MKKGYRKNLKLYERIYFTGIIEKGSFGSYPKGCPKKKEALGVIPRVAQMKKEALGVIP